MTYMKRTKSLYETVDKQIVIPVLYTASNITYLKRTQSP